MRLDSRGQRRGLVWLMAGNCVAVETHGALCGLEEQGKTRGLVEVIPRLHPNLPSPYLEGESGAQIGLTR
jgi:hypothetical protein